MIREDKDPAFWTSVAAHPALAHLLRGQSPDLILGLVERGVALRAENGGLIFVLIDCGGRIAEMHTLFTPAGWGREAFIAMAEAVEFMFERCDLVVTHQTDHPQSAPPRTFNFQPAAELQDTAHGPIRLWTLTKPAWRASPARRRI